MEGIIKKIVDGETYPITVIDAVAVGDGTNKMLKDWLLANYLQLKNIQQEVTEVGAAPVSSAAIYKALDTKITMNGESGQIPISNGDGTVTWTTLRWAEEGEF